MGGGDSGSYTVARQRIVWRDGDKRPRETLGLN